MGYSGPALTGIGIANPSSGGLRPDLRIPQNASSLRSRDAPLEFDQRNVNRPFEEARYKNQQIGNFLSFFNQSLQPKLIEATNAAAKREAGEAIDSYPGILTAASDDQKAIDRMNALSPLAKDYAIRARMKAQIGNYQAYAAQGVTENIAILTDPNDAPEAEQERALLRSKIFSDARQKAFAGIPSYTVMENADQLSRIDRSLNTQLYTERGKNQAIEIENDLVAGAGENLGTAALEIIRRPDGDVDTAAQVSDLSGLVQTIQDTFKQRSGSQNNARLWAAAIVGGISRMTSDSERESYMKLIQLAMDTPLMSANGRNIWLEPMQTRNGNTTTLKQIVDERVPVLEARAEKENQKDFDVKLTEKLDEGDYEGARQLISANLQLLDPREYATYLEVIERTSSTLTDEDERASLEMEQRVFINGEDPQTVLGEMIENELAGVQQYDPKVKQRILSQVSGQMDRERTGAENFTATELTFAKGMRDPATYDYFEKMRAQYYQLTEEGKRNPNLAKQLREEELGAIRVSTIFMKDVRIEFGKLLEDNTDGKSVNELIQQAADNVLGQKQRQAPGGISAARQPAKQQYSQWYGGAGTRIENATRNNKGVMVIPFEALAPSIQESYMKMKQITNSAAASAEFKKMDPKKQAQWLKISIETQAPPSLKDPAKKKKWVNQQYNQLIQDARKGANTTPTNRPQGPAERASLPTSVPVTEQEQREAPDDPWLKQVVAALDNASMGLLSGKGDEAFAKEAGRKWFNDNGEGSLAVVTTMVGGMFDTILGAAPASASMLYSEADSVKALQQAFSGTKRELSSPQLPQLASATPVRLLKNAITSVNHELFVAIGISEGTRTPSGGFTQAYYGHTDPGDGNRNVGTVSGGRGRAKTPQAVDREYMKILTEVQYKVAPVLKGLGLQPGTAGYNRVMFNILDLEVQAPAAVPDFIRKLGDVKAQGFTIDAIAKARADSFFTPAGNLDAPGFNNNYSLLLKDQRARAGVYDYKKRL